VPAARRSGAGWRLAFAALCAGSGLTLAGTRLAALGIFSHFQAWAALAWLLALALFAILPRARAAFRQPRRAAAAGAALLAAHAALIGWEWLPAPPPATQRETVELRVVAFNMRHDRDALAAVARTLAGDPPDLWVLTETTRDTALGSYEHVFHDQPDAIGIWSRHPLERPRAESVAGDRDQLLATVVVGSHRLPLLAVHWRIPLARSQGDAAETSARLAAAEEHLLALGDFNSTPWSPRFRSFAAAAGLRRADGLGTRGTWAADAWRLFALPIDQMLVKGDVRVREIEFLPWTASDHRPLWALVECGNRR
jgi:endonuclease/exonuclease/phosphatase (EEP) superfamily protein YafD